MSPFAPIDAWLCPPPDPARVGWLAQSTYAHRGLHGGGRVENSPSAFAAAIERGLGIECDVQRSRDGQAMVFHDWDLDRLTSESGQVNARDSAELCGIKLSGRISAVSSAECWSPHAGKRVWISWFSSFSSPSTPE